MDRLCCSYKDAKWAQAFKLEAGPPARDQSQLHLLVRPVREGAPLPRCCHGSYVRLTPTIRMQIGDPFTGLGRVRSKVGT
jgi:hypothetical protein